MERVVTEESLPPTVSTPSRRGLLLAALAGLATAGTVAAGGIISRARSKEELVRWTNAQAIPTVALAEIKPSNAQESLILPGSIQPLNKAAIYARVSGYLKSWEQDIGAHVKAGQLLATIDSPDLDQQLAQAKADLATAQANEALAISTAQRYAKLIGARHRLAAGDWTRSRATRREEGDGRCRKSESQATAGNGILQEHRRSLRRRRDLAQHRYRRFDQCREYGRARAVRDLRSQPCAHLCRGAAGLLG
jgi:multidrug efflux pump subunit AcrA (membrane-fusion protein)